MATSKSRSEVFYLDLLLSVIEQDPLGICSPKQLELDLRTACDRFEHEGLGFLTKLLPKLGKALDKGLLDTSLSVPREFQKAHGCTNVPAFLQVYFKRVFSANGSLLEHADADAVRHLRQVCFMLYKLEIPYTDEQQKVVLDTFVATDGNLQLEGDSDACALRAAASYIIREVLGEFDPKQILPRHGPGAVATGEKLDDKWQFSRHYRAIHRVYPYYEYYLVGWAKELVDRLAWYKSLERHESGVAKVVLVPKDSRGPRLISCEPLEYQWIQQGLGRKLMAHLEDHSLTAGRVNFTDQTVNQQLALQSSVTGEWATLDLKDASDRVSLQLVEELFQHNAEMLKALKATRTTATALPDGRVVELRKFAPMGSALCFPVEALCFWALAVAAISRETRRRYQSVGRSVYVFGDDIIVPTDHADCVIRALESAGLKVNRDKSCLTGNFRESCGCDAFKGVVVTPLRVKKLWFDEAQGPAYASYVAFANQIAERGYANCASLVWGKLEDVYGPIPFGTRTSPFPCRWVDSPFQAELLNRDLVRWRLNTAYQRIEFRVLTLKSKRTVTGLDGWARLLRGMTQGGGDDPDHVVHPRSTQIKAGWRSV